MISCTGLTVLQWTGDILHGHPGIQKIFGVYEDCVAITGEDHQDKGKWNDFQCFISLGAGGNVISPVTLCEKSI